MVQLLERSREETPATGSKPGHVFAYATHPFDRDNDRIGTGKRWTAQRVTGYTVFNIFIGGLLFIAAVAGAAFLCVTSFDRAGASSASASLDSFNTPTSVTVTIPNVAQTVASVPAADAIGPPVSFLPLRKGFRWAPRKHQANAVTPDDPFPVSTPISNVTSPGTTSPGTTAPSATNPPGTTEPPTTRPVVTTEPPTTEPPTTEPPTTDPPTTEPPTTDPPVTIPPVTLPDL